MKILRFLSPTASRDVTKALYDALRCAVLYISGAIFRNTTAIIIIRAMGTRRIPVRATSDI